MLLGESWKNPAGVGSREAEGKLIRADKSGEGDTEERPSPASEDQCRSDWHIFFPDWQQNENSKASVVSFL